MKTTKAFNHSLILSLDQAFDRKSWHGTNLKGAVRGLNAVQAAWRPDSARHSIWEQVLHCAYWKYTVCRRLLSEKRGSFPRKKSDWPLPSGGDERAWKADVRLLLEIHQKLRNAVLGLSHEELLQTTPGNKVDNLSLITGIIAHDLYHAGQIQLLKRLGAKQATG